MDDYLAHYGVMGMRWGVRKDPQKAYERADRKYSRLKQKSIKFTNKARVKSAKVYRTWSDPEVYTRRQHRVAKISAKSNRYSKRAERWLKKMEKTFSGITVDMRPGSALNPISTKIGQQEVDLIMSRINNGTLLDIKR